MSFYTARSNPYGMRSHYDDIEEAPMTASAPPARDPQLLEKLLRSMPDGHEKERAANAHWEEQIVDRVAGKIEARRALPPEVLADALHDRIHPTSGKLLKAEPIKTPVTLQPGDHVMLRLNEAEEQRCVVVEAPTCHTVALRPASGGPARDFLVSQCTKVNPIPVKEPTVTRGKVRLKPGRGL